MQPIQITYILTTKRADQLPLNDISRAHTFSLELPEHTPPIVIGAHVGLAVAARVDLTSYQIEKIIASWEGHTETIIMPIAQFPGGLLHDE